MQTERGNKTMAKIRYTEAITDERLKEAIRNNPGIREAVKDIYVECDCNTILKALKPETHVYKILNHLIMHKTISSPEAFELYRNTRLASTIEILRHTYGSNIETEPIIDRDGNKMNYMRYRLLSEVSEDVQPI